MADASRERSRVRVSVVSQDKWCISCLTVLVVYMLYYVVISQIEARDAEIERLGRVLDGGRPYDVVALEAKNRSSEKLISHLNIQVRG